MDTEHEPGENATIPLDELSTMPTMPNDVLGAIISNIRHDETDKLKNLCLTSTFTLHLARQRIYGAITLISDDAAFLGYFRSITFKKMACLLTNDPGIANYVERLSLMLLTTYTEDPNVPLVLKFFKNKNLRALFQITFKYEENTALGDVMGPSQLLASLRLGPGDWDWADMTRNMRGVFMDLILTNPVSCLSLSQAKNIPLSVLLNPNLRNLTCDYGTFTHVDVALQRWGLPPPVFYEVILQRGTQELISLLSTVRHDGLALVNLSSLSSLRVHIKFDAERAVVLPLAKTLLNANSALRHIDIAYCAHDLSWLVDESESILLRMLRRSLNYDSQTTTLPLVACDEDLSTLFQAISTSPCSETLQHLSIFLTAFNSITVAWLPFRLFWHLKHFTNLQTLRFTASIPNERGDFEGDFEKLDKLLTASEYFPALKRVHLTINLTWGTTDEERGHWQNLAKKKLNRLTRSHSIKLHYVTSR